MASRDPLHVLILGDQEAPEFAGLRRYVAERAKLASAANPDIDLILLLVARPGRFSLRDVERLRDTSPLARLVHVVGPWCYGEGRTGQPLPGAERVQWFEWPYRLPRILETSGLPLTATPQERIVADLASLERAVRPEGTIGIVASTRTDFQMLASACRALDVAAVWLTADCEAAGGCSALVAICPGTDGPEFRAARDAFRASGQIPKVVCLGTPTLDDWHAVQAAGATALLGQPFRLADLAATLAESSELHNVDNTRP